MAKHVFKSHRMKFSKRINSVIAAVEECSGCADVGCDHGYIGAGVLKAGKAEHVYFCDISQKCLDKARKACSRFDPSSCSFHCVDGLGDLEPDTAVIAGMGGMEIISILSKAKLPRKLVLQPAKNARELRLFLADKYDFLYEKMIYDIKFYPLMVLNIGGGSVNELESVFGVKPKIDADYLAYIDYRYKEILSVLDRASPSALMREKELIETYFKNVINIKQ